MGRATPPPVRGRVALSVLTCAALLAAAAPAAPSAIASPVAAPPVAAPPAPESTTSGAAKVTRGPGPQTVQEALSCERLAGRCVGISPALPIDPPSRTAAASPAAADRSGTAAGPACPGTGLPDPVRDDWCERWVVKRGLGPQGVSEVPAAIAVSPDGSELYVLAFAVTTDPHGAAVMVFDAATGAVRRTLPIPYRFLGPGSEFYAAHIAVSADTIFVAGSVRDRVETPEGFERHANYLTVAHRLDGTVRWASRYQGPMTGKGADHGDWPTGIALSHDGAQVLVTGVSTRPGPYQQDPYFLNRLVSPDDVATVSYDTATGAQRWVQRFDSGELEFPYGLALSPDGSGLYVNTMSWRFESNLVAYGGLAAGGGPALNWVHAEDPAAFLAPIAVASTADGVYLTGVSLANPSGTLDYGVLAMSPDGALRWRANHSRIYTIAGTDYTSADLPMAMAADGDRVYVTGYAYEWDVLHAAGDPSPAMVPSTVAFDSADGTSDWTSDYRFPGHRIGFPFGLHLSGDRLFVPGLDSECNWYVSGTGYYCQSTAIDLVTLDYAAATGTLGRVGRFNHGRVVGAAGIHPSLPTAPGFDFIGPSAVGPGGRLHITTMFDAPCLGECYPGAYHRLGAVSY